MALIRTRTFSIDPTIDYEPTNEENEKAREYMAKKRASKGLSPKRRTKIAADHAEHLRIQREILKLPEELLSLPNLTRTVGEALRKAHRKEGK